MRIIRFTIALLLLVFLLVTYLVVTNNTGGFDSLIYNAIFSIRNNFFDFLFKNITRLCDTLTILILVIILVLLIKDKSRYIVGITAISTVLTNQILKHIIERARPDHLHLIKQGGYSYPSGHSMIAVAVYGFLIYYVNKKITNKYLRVIFTILLLVLILLVGISRIYLGVHYPSDVLGAYLLALTILLLVIQGVEKYD